MTLVSKETGPWCFPVVWEAGSEPKSSGAYNIDYSSREALCAPSTPPAGHLHKLWTDRGEALCERAAASFSEEPFSSQIGFCCRRRSKSAQTSCICCVPPVSPLLILHNKSSYSLYSFAFHGFPIFFFSLATLSICLRHSMAARYNSWRRCSCCSAKTRRLTPNTPNNLKVRSPHHRWLHSQHGKS